MTPEEIANEIAFRFDGMSLDYVYIGGEKALLNVARTQLASTIAAALVGYGAARAAAERKRAASIASLVFVNDPYALHPDIPFDRLNESARTAAHSIAQTIAGLIMDAPD